MSPVSGGDGDVIYALAFSPWKRPALRCCFPGRRVVFVRDAKRVPPNGQLAVWGTSRLDDSLSAGVKVIHIEDGFLRSVGLGADLVRPISWVLDHQGIYYDATRPSDIEQLLVSVKVEPEMLARVESLVRRIVAEGLTKYNVGGAAWQRPAHVTRLVLVPGQVETDASLNYGAPQIRTNTGLLRAVRQANPDAYILYKPHPDVISGLRAAGVEEQSVVQWCDEVIVNASMGDLLSVVDELHVLTSLAGFEALLRSKPVTCYGQPFYAGWGLTTDVVPISRRQRRLSLYELAACALILYPVYMSRGADKLITPEQALDELQAWRAKSGGITPWWRELARIALRRIVGVR